MRQPALTFWFILAATLTASAQQPPQQAPDFSKAQVKVQKLADDVYLLQSSGVRAGMGNMGVYAGEDGGFWDSLHNRRSVGEARSRC
jgi:hypothetical protein